MEFTDVVHRRRMVRSYAPDPVDSAQLNRILANALHAPSAGFTQGWAFLVLDTPADVRRFWQATTDERQYDTRADNAWLEGMTRAPCVVVPMSNRDAYLDRYAEGDKGWTDRDEARWPVPYWHIDAGMASLLMLLTAVDEGLGACFFGIAPEHRARFLAEFGVPDAYTPIGAITVGHRTSDAGPRGSAGRGRRTDVIHRGRWQG